MSDGTVAIIGGEVRQRAVATLVAAFIADPVERWLYPGSFEYLAHFGRFIESFAGRAFEVGTAWAAADLSAVALWLPPGTAPDEDAVVRMLSETVAPEKQADTFATLEQMAAAHPTPRRPPIRTAAAPEASSSSIPAHVGKERARSRPADSSSHAHA